jgi:hypothetical protein
MQAAELTAEFAIAGILDFVETEHGLVKAAVSLDGVAGELYLQGAHLRICEELGDRRRSPLREWPPWVESGCGAVVLGRPCLFPPLSSGGALVGRP